MKTTYIFFILFVITLGTFLISCRKNIEETTVDPSNNFGLGEIGKDFSWKTSDNIAFNIGMNISSVGNALCRINIYSQDQAGMTTMMYSGSVNNGKTLVTSVTIPSAMRMVSLELLQPDGSSKIETLPVASNVNYTFTDSGLKGTTGFTDTDGDGIADLIDDYPSDRGKAFHFAFPNGSGNTKSTLSPVYWGTWCFEDLWPSMGDFDMNDLVINYQWEVTTDASHFVQTITGHFKVKAAGSCEAWRHGVGIVLNGVPANQVQTVTGYNLETGSYIQLNAKGIEPDAAGNNAKPAVVIPFDNFDNVIQNPTSGFFNTLSTIPCGTSTEQEMLITLVNPTTVTDVAIIIGNFDPFMIRNRTRNFEIHRADYQPTSYADLSNFGKGDDNSRPSEGKWYRTHENLPWALDIPVDFNYPAEYISIVDAYPEFKGWAQSGGTANQAWYNNPNTQPGLIFSCESSGNSAPLATTVGQTGTAAVGQTMTGGYTYSDVDGDLEGNSIFKWYRSDDSNGTNEAQITGVSGKIYLMQTADANKYIRFSVTPMAQTGTTLGHEVKASGYAGPVTSASANCGSPFTDSRDGKTYNTVLIGNQCWMKDNLNIGTRIDRIQEQTNNGTIEKYCYNNLESNCDVYGGLYLWGEMMQYYTPDGIKGICPTGWHIPTNLEWITLTTYLGGTAVAGSKMKETGTIHWNSPNTATNESGFTILPGGYSGVGFTGQYSGLNISAQFWSSTSVPDYFLNQGAWFLGVGGSSVSSNKGHRGYGFSVRCIKGETIPPVLGLPTVTTEIPTNLTQNSVTLGGNVTNDGGAPVTARGIVYDANPYPPIQAAHTSDGSGTGNFTHVLALYGGTTYYARAYATNSEGTGYGNQVSFTLLQNPALPILTTTAVTNIAQTTATSGGNVISPAGSSVIARGVCWSISQNPTIEDDHTTDGIGTGMFISNLTGLKVNTLYTLYYVRAYATNSEGTSYGNQIFFTTMASPCGSSITVSHLISGGVAPVNKTVTYGIISNIPGEPSKCWITSNLGADHQAAAVDDATEASAGWYWQFNRKQGYKHNGNIRTPNTSWITSIIEDIEWRADNDPCGHELENGWRLPTETEWNNVSGSGNWINWNGPWNSALKLHAAGHLDISDGSLLSNGSQGFYWSNTQGDVYRGKLLQFESEYFWMTQQLKMSGNTLRCLRD